jgi:hypothetical protein
VKLERTTTGIRLTLGTTVREVAIGSPAHVAITRQGSGWSIWINGTLADSFNTNYTVPTKPATIGPVNTVLDEIRLTQTALYAVPFIPPAVPHQAWYQGNPIFTKGQITQGLQLIEGQITGSKGSITEGSVLPNAQTGGSKGQILQGTPITPPAIIPSQRQFTKGSITNGSIIPFGIYPGQSQFTKGSIYQGKILLLGERWIKGIIFQATAPDPIPYNPGPPVLAPGQRQYTKGSITFGAVVLFNGSLIVPSQRQFTKGSITQGKIDIFGNTAIPNKRDGIQGSLLSDAGIVPWINKQITQGNPLPPYTGWDPSDITRIMETLGIPITKDNLEQIQKRLDEIRTISIQSQKRIQSLLAHRDGLWLELTRTLQPVSYRIPNGELQRAKGSPWKNRHRSRLINKEQRIIRKQIEAATGIPDRLKQIPLELMN